MTSPNCEMFVGLDFGATFSKMTVIRRNGDSYATVYEDAIPTVLTRDATSQTIQYPHFQSLHHHSTSNDLEFFKLALMEPEAYRKGCSESKLVDLMATELSKLAKSGMRYTDVTAIFLKGFWDKMSNTVSKNRCQCQFHHMNVAVTYPSCWNEYELGRLQMAVNAAGIPSETRKVCYMTEQAAASFGVLDEYREKLPGGLQEGDSMMVIDGGGLTVDSAIYKLKQNRNGNWIVGELVDEESFVYGTKSMDLGFEALLSEKLERTVVPASLNRKHIEREARREWSSSKRLGLEFQRLDFFQRGMTINADEGEFHFGIHQDGVFSILEEAVNRVVGVVTRFSETAKHRNTTPKALFLTGGFFRTKWIAVDVEQKVKSALGDGFLVIPSPKNQELSRTRPLSDYHCLDVLPNRMIVARGAAHWLCQNGN